MKPKLTLVSLLALGLVLTSCGIADSTESAAAVESATEDISGETATNDSGSGSDGDGADDYEVDPEYRANFLSLHDVEEGSEEAACFDQYPKVVGTNLANYDLERYVEAKCTPDRVRGVFSRMEAPGVTEEQVACIQTEAMRFIGQLPDDEGIEVFNEFGPDESGDWVQKDGFLLSTSPYRAEIIPLAVQACGVTADQANAVADSHVSG